mmetsp:Transcript_41324/g.76908  ORF Transcript_41324/g.76908 Transcript_41324/m.76908 type:complete len:113 (+) Transcript_41324:212-550(+)
MLEPLSELDAESDSAQGFHRHAHFIGKVAELQQVLGQGGQAESRKDGVETSGLLVPGWVSPGFDGSKMVLQERDQGESLLEEPGLKSSIANVWQYHCKQLARAQFLHHLPLL